VTDWWDELARRPRGVDLVSAKIIHRVGNSRCTLGCGAGPCGEKVDPRRVPSHDESTPAFEVPSGWFVSRVGSDPVIVLCPEHARERIQKVTGPNVLSFEEGKRWSAGEKGNFSATRTTGLPVERSESLVRLDSVRGRKNDERERSR
jgi:hypothetical protein